MVNQDNAENHPPEPDYQSSQPDSEHNLYNTQPTTPLPASSRTELPGLVKVWGSCMGCLIGLVIGLILSLICLIPSVYAFEYVVGGRGGDPLSFIIVATIFIALITTILGAINGPSWFGKLLKAIGNAFRWMTGSR